METFNLLKDHYEFFSIILAVIVFLVGAYIKLMRNYEMQKWINEHHSSRLRDLEEYNKKDVQEIKHNMIKIMTLMEGNYKIKFSD